MGAQHLVKTGLMGMVGRYDAPDFTRYPRDARVICRTDRGLEQGTVICDLEGRDSTDESPTVHLDGQLLRRVGREDELILTRLDRYRDKAFFACQKLIDERQLPAILVDVEHLFDGESVFFYFLGEVDARLESLTHELGTEYERKVRFKKFAETLANGCGPDCGTGATGCGTGGCSTCAVSGGCGIKSE
jgi:hypothetical protein